MEEALLRLAEFSVHFKVGECRLNGDLIRINKSRTSLEDKRFEPWYLRLYCNNRLVPVSPLWQPKSQFLKSVPCLTGNQGAIVQWQDRQYVGGFWGQNQHNPHILPMNYPHVTHVPYGPTFHQHLSCKEPT